MVRLIDIKGVPVDAEESAVRRMLNSGFFRLAEGESAPEMQPDPEPEDITEPEPAPPIDFGAFGEEDGIEDEDDIDLMSLTNAELISLAESYGASVPKKANKAQLVAIVEKARG